MSNVSAKVKQLIVENLKVDPEKVTETASFTDDLGADSLDQMEMIMKFEEEFNCEIPDETAAKLTTVGAAINYIQEKSLV